MLYIDLISKHNTLFDRKVYKIKVKSHQTFICQLAPRPPTLPYNPCSCPLHPPRSFLTILSCLAIATDELDKVWRLYLRNIYITFIYDVIKKLKINY